MFIGAHELMGNCARARICIFAIESRKRNCCNKHFTLLAVSAGSREHAAIDRKNKFDISFYIHNLKIFNKNNIIIKKG